MRRTSVDELVRLHDERAQHVDLNPRNLIDEIPRRDNGWMISRIERLTWLIAICAVVSAAALVVSIVR